jgi:hypothetical protein
MRIEFLFMLWILCFKPRKQSVKQTKNKLRGFQPANELYQPIDRRLSATLVPTFCGFLGVA